MLPLTNTKTRIRRSDKNFLLMNFMDDQPARSLNMDGHTAQEEKRREENAMKMMVTMMMLGDRVMSTG